MYVLKYLYSSSVLHPLGTSHLSSVSLILHVVNVSYKWPYTTGGLFWLLASLSRMISPLISVVGCINTLFLWLSNNILLFAYIIVFLSIHHLMGIGIVSSFWLLWGGCYAHHCTPFACHVLSVCFTWYGGVDLLRGKVTLCSVLWGTSKLFSKLLNGLTIPSEMYKASSFFTSLPTGATVHGLVF